MRFPGPLTRGVLVQRYKRFLADVRLDAGEVVTAHCANPGSMMGLKAPGLPVWLSAAPPGRKLAWSLELVEADGGLVAINTNNPNRLAAEAIAAGAIPELAGYAAMRREVPYGANSRVDLVLEDPGRPRAWVEVKNCHLRRTGSLAEFPDSVTTRGAKHLSDLSDRVAAGDRAVMLFVIQRMDCDLLAPAADLDPAYAAALASAADAGVEVLAYACAISTEGVEIASRVPVRVAPGREAR
jgi:sugar fermentation stimulation protein A